MKRLIYHLVITVLVVAVAVFLTSCLKYNPPEGFTTEHHTYNEIFEFARKLDSGAEVSEKYNDTLIKEGTVKYNYREWPAVINGMKCHVSSVTDYVWNEGFLGGEFCKPYYRIDTDYDYCLLAQILSEKQPEWELHYPENDLFGRYNCNSVLSITTSYCQSDRLSNSELEVFWHELSEVNKLYSAYPVSDRLYFMIHSPQEFVDVYTKESTVNPDNTIVAYDFSEEGKKHFFKEYNENWDLLNRDNPIE